MTEGNSPNEHKGEGTERDMMVGAACARCGRKHVALLDGSMCGMCRMAVIEEIKDKQRMVGLYRVADESGVSGRGLVATGVQLPDGGVALQWLNEANEDLETTRNGWAIYPGPDGITDAMAVLREGRTKVVVV